jgi:hypothetical protein
MLEASSLGDYCRAIGADDVMVGNPGLIALALAAADRVAQVFEFHGLPKITTSASSAPARSPSRPRVVVPPKRRVHGIAQGSD